METFWKTVIAGAAGLLALGVSAASAASRPDRCTVDHDHRSHASNYYDYYGADKYSRAGPYRGSGLSFTISFGDNDRYDRRGRYDRGGRYDRDDRYDRGRRNGYRGRDGRVVNREVYDTRYRARIVLTEEVVRSRRGPRLLCTVDARGPQARYVSKRRLREIARRECSPRARIQILS